MNTKIRQETESDFAAVYDILKTAFDQKDEADLVDLLRLSDAFIPQLSLVATQDNQIVGYILFTKIKIRGGKNAIYESLALAPVAVSPDWQKQGIGGQLIRAGLEQAKKLGHSSVIVLGHEHYYPKFGFQPARKWQIKAPFEVPTEVFMALELTKNGLAGVTGTVKYDKAFEQV